MSFAAIVECMERMNIWCIPDPECNACPFVGPQVSRPPFGGELRFLRQYSQSNAPLPAWKQRSIDRLDVGISNKVYFRFPHTFWPLGRIGVYRVAETPEAKWSTWFNFTCTRAMTAVRVYTRC